jgi:hypothetical protein
MRCPLTLTQIAERLQQKSYAGTPAGTAGSNLNYAWVISDLVPSGHYWVIYYAAGIILAGTGSDSVGLWIVPPGKQPPANGAPYTRNSFFNGDTAFNANGPPIGGLVTRVDEIDANLTAEIFTIGSEISLLRKRKLLLPAGHRLMVYNGADAASTGGSAFQQLGLKISFVDCLESEDFGLET